MSLEMIVAMDPLGTIGHQNRLPWNYPDELRFFQAMTIHKTVVMGRKTFESLPKPLKNRRHLVITNSFPYYDPPVHLKDTNPIIMNLDDFLYYQDVNSTRIKPDSLIIIGGKMLYEELLPEVNKIFLTKILDSFPGDTQMSQEFMNTVNDESLWCHNLLMSNTRFDSWELIRK